MNTIKDVVIYDHIEVDSYFLAKYALGDLVMYIERSVGSVGISPEIFTPTVICMMDTIHSVFDTLMASIVLEIQSEPSTADKRAGDVDTFMKSAWSKLVERYEPDGAVVPLDTGRYIQCQVENVHERISAHVKRCLKVDSIDETSECGAYLDVFVAHLEDFLSSDELYLMARDHILTGFNKLRVGDTYALADLVFTVSMATDMIISVFYADTDVAQSVPANATVH